MKKSKKKICFILIPVLAVCICIAAYTSIYVIRVENCIEKMEKMINVPQNYSEVIKLYGDFFNNYDYKEELSLYYEEDEHALYSYQAKYLTALLCADSKEEFIRQFKKFSNEYSADLYSDFLNYLYTGVNAESLDNSKLFLKAINLLESANIFFDNTDKNLLYNSFLCFCQFTDPEGANEKMVAEVKKQAKEEFEEFWDQECLKYCSVLLLGKDPNRFSTVFANAYKGRYFSSKSLACMINTLGCTKDQLELLANAMKDLSDTMQDDFKKKSLRTLVDIIESQEAGTVIEKNA